MLIIKISKNGDINNITKYNLNFINNNKSILNLYTWKFNEYDYKLYGYENGIAGNENKYDLPPPIDNNLYFNDLYLLKYKNDEIINLTLEDYKNFYETLFGGFEDILENNDEISSELSEHTSDRDFIDDDDISIEYSSDSDNLEIEISDLSLSSCPTTCNNITTDEEEEEEEEEDKHNKDIEKDEENDIEDDEENNEDISSIEITLSCSDEEEHEPQQNKINF
jgi:hypothetical protein